MISLPMPPDSAHARVLLIDDDGGIRRLIGTLLQRGGFSYDEAENGQLAIEKLRNGSWDAVLLDLMLPIVNGFEVIDFIKAEQMGMLHQVIVVTAVSNSTLETLPDQHLLFKVVRKPFDVNELMATLDACAKQGNGRGEVVASGEH
jgi:DNA-binding response OmpR family regulator